MNAIVFLFVIGGLSALLYFGGLWWTVRRLADLRHPAAAYLGSLMLRVVCLLCVIWLAISNSESLALAAFFAGFLLVRVFVVRHLAGPLSRMSES